MEKWNSFHHIARLVHFVISTRFELKSRPFPQTLNFRHLHRVLCVNMKYVQYERQNECNDGSEPIVECFSARARAKLSNTHTCTFHMEEIFRALPNL